MLVQAVIAFLSAIGLRTTWWLWTDAWPEKYVKPRVPKALPVRMTSDSDHRGLYL